MYKRYYKNEIILTEKDVRKENPNVSFKRPFDPSNLDYFLILNTDPPVCSGIKEAVRDGVEYVDGQWQFKWTTVDKFVDVQIAKSWIQNTNKNACTRFILTKYPKAIQRSAALGVYPQGVVDSMADHIARIIAEENRVFDLLDEAVTIEELNTVETPIWPEV